MNEMLRSLGFGQVHANKWTNGSTMSVIEVDKYFKCIFRHSWNIRLTYVIENGDLESMKHHVEKFMSMVGKCIQVDEE